MDLMLWSCTAGIAADNGDRPYLRPSGQGPVDHGCVPHTTDRTFDVSDFPNVFNAWYVHVCIMLEWLRRSMMW